MIQAYNIVSGKYNNQSTVKFNFSQVCNTRGNSYKLQELLVHYNLRKHFFSNRIIAVWNGLPNTVVSAESTNTFTNRLDKFGVNKDVKFNWKADITGIGSRSIHI
jgi:hypothetical protein